MTQPASMVSNRVLLEGALVGVTHCRCRSPRCGCGPERADADWHLALVSRGAFTAHYGRTAHLGDPCTALFYDPQDSYRISHPLDGGDEFTVIAPAPSLVEEAFAGRTGPRRLMSSPISARTRLAHARLLAGGRRPSGRLELEESALELLAALAGDVEARAVARPTPARSRRHVLRAQAILNETFREDLGLERLAREAACSPFHLSRLFRQQTGQTLRGYRLELRLSAALERLMEGERDLAGLAAELGFASHSHLTSSFRQVMGQTPSAVRSRLHAVRRAA